LAEPDPAFPAENPVVPVALAPAFTVAPQLQIINHRRCFSGFVGI
jgi:hypothetical protein